MKIQLEEKVRVGQIYKHVHSDQQIEIMGKAGGKWRAVVLTPKPGVYAGSHKMSEHALAKHFKLIHK